MVVHHRRQRCRQPGRQRRRVNRGVVVLVEHGPGQRVEPDVLLVIHVKRGVPHFGVAGEINTVKELLCRQWCVCSDSHLRFSCRKVEGGHVAVDVEHAVVHDCGSHACHVDWHAGEVVRAIRVDIGSVVAGGVATRVQHRHHRRGVHVDVAGIERVGEEARRTDVGVHVREGVYIARCVAADLVRRAVDVNVRLRNQLTLLVQLERHGNRGAVVHPDHHLGADIKTDVEQQVGVVAHGADHRGGLGRADIHLALLGIEEHSLVGGG